ncbi:MAG: M23 family metallopeptidase [Polyangiales bacterium]
MEFQRGPTVAFAVTRGGRGRWRAERVEVLVTASRVEAGFRVRGGVEASVRAAGLDLSIVMGLAECFTAMDLPPTLSEGDLVRLVVDEERLNREFSRYGRVLAVDYRGVHGDRRAYWLPRPRRGDWFDPEGNSWERGPLRSPLPGAAVTARFDPARVHPTLHRLMPHNGVDYAAPEGTPVYAAAEGLVTWANESGTSGNLVRVRHAALGVESGYAHLSVIEEGLRPGQRVRLRQRVGLVGSTGRSTGPHLHFSVQRGGAFIDPLSMHGDRRSVPPALRGRFEADRADLDAALDRVAVEGVTLSPPTRGRSLAAPAPAPPPGFITPGPPRRDGGRRTDGAPRGLSPRAAAAAPLCLGEGLFCLRGLRDEEHFERTVGHLPGRGDRRGGRAAPRPSELRHLAAP